MTFLRIPPPDELKNIIECYWIVENSDPAPLKQKIIPDGFPELIFHFADPYLIRLKNSWELQSRKLFAGQISQHFYLQNTGSTEVLGVKLRPTALTHLYKIPMDSYLDKVVDLSIVPQLGLELLVRELEHTGDQNERVSMLNEYFSPLARQYNPGLADKAIDMIFSANGLLSISNITSRLFTTERQLQRAFKTFVGLSPKFYCRIIRFSYIFECMQTENVNWTDISYNAGYYDQSHFIRNFKAFTGEEPSSYLFEQSNLANFFLKKDQA